MLSVENHFSTFSSQLNVKLQLVFIISNHFSLMYEQHIMTQYVYILIKIKAIDLPQTHNNKIYFTDTTW